MEGLLSTGLPCQIFLYITMGIGQKQYHAYQGLSNFVCGVWQLSRNDKGYIQLKILVVLTIQTGGGGWGVPSTTNYFAIFNRGPANY